MIKKDKIFFLVFHLFVIAFVFFLKTSAVCRNEIFRIFTDGSLCLHVCYSENLS